MLPADCNDTPTLFFSSKEYSRAIRMEAARRVGMKSGQDILITPDRESSTVCCLPDDTCGPSTDESHSTLEFLAGGPAAAVTRS